MLATVLAGTSLGWLGEGSSVAAAPAELISVDPKAGGPLSTNDFEPSMSGDGNIVLFNSDAFTSAGGLVQNVYVRNRPTGTTTPVPLPAQVTSPNFGVLSRDGCHVAFWGFLNTFVVPGRWIVYVWDRCANTAPVAISAVPLAFGAIQTGPLAISADGRYVAYIANAASGLAPRIARIDTNAPVSESVLAGLFASANSIDISDDGKYVAVGGHQGTSDLVRGWTPPCATFCPTDLVSVGTTPGQPAAGYSAYPSVSADGRYVAFASDAADVVAGLPAPVSLQVYVRDRVAGVTKLVTDTPSQPMPAALGVSTPDISPDGNQIALTQTDNFETSEVWVARSTSGYFDTAVFDLVSSGVSGAPVGAGATGPAMSSNGRYVAFSSGANDELSGGTVPLGSAEIWLRTRPIALDITPSIDFGTVDVGGQSAPKNAVITNTSGVAINISAVTPPAAPFSVTANTCGGVLQPGATCSVTIVFSPTAGGSASSSVNVAGDGLSISASLAGIGRIPAPTPGSLTIKPTSVNYGTVTVGSSVAPKKFVVSNPGQTAVTITAVGLTGAGFDQFSIVPGGCPGSLAGGTSCTLQVGATATREGAMTAILGVTGAGGESASATLRIKGAPAAIVPFTPTLKMNPGVIAPGQITAAIGSDFPPNIDVELAFEGEAPFATVHTDAAGAFRYDYLVLRNGVRIGGRQVIAVDQPQFSGVRAPLLLGLGTFRPSGFNSPRFSSGVRTLVTRGG